MSRMGIPLLGNLESRLASYSGPPVRAAGFYWLAKIALSSLPGVVGTRPACTGFGAYLLTAYAPVVGESLPSNKTSFEFW